MNEIHIDPTILEQEIGVMKELLNIKITETKEDTDNEGKAIEKNEGSSGVLQYIE
ncbi:hypothetical protein [Listeria fleischmannii]|uniref:hypothetical protein n=1 Tax=Listeria fleischmannii TaxID=1069827 RepID=UPI0004B43CCF|nr:hypothetical protein [Listeria fleischmannii]